MNRPSKEAYRPPNADQIAMLVAQGNQAEDWQRLLLAENFDCDCVQNCSFSGEVRLASFAAGYTEKQGLKLPRGIYHSRLNNVHIMGAVAIHHVDYLSNMVIEHDVLLFRVGEITSSLDATFGHGQNADQALKVANENAGRKIFAFAGMLSADAWLWSRNPHDEKLCQQFYAFTQKKKQHFKDSKNFGFIDAGTVIRHSESINDCWIGEKTSIAHAKILKNLCILSLTTSPVKIDGASQLLNGIIADGCQFSVDSKAYNFACDQNSELAYGASLFNSYLGASSQISSGEVRNSLIFPAHVQHHRNSFLIAATLSGQSNLAAGATLGSNHNSRAADGELQAARGFWVGLSATLSYNSRFASFTLLSHGSYAAEMNIPYPFSLLSCSQGQVKVRPAYWLQHNIYALERNHWKFLQRDRRQNPQQFCHYDYLEADTAAEIFEAIELLKSLQGSKTASLVKRQDAEIIKASKAIISYRRMLIYYFVKVFYEYWKNSKQPLSKVVALRGQVLEWQNVGGQIMSKTRSEKLLEDVRKGVLSSWDEVHQRYKEINSYYLQDRYVHAQDLAAKLLGNSLTVKDWGHLCHEACETATWIYETALDKRQSDFTDPFEQACYSSKAEQKAVLGTVENNVFLTYLKEKQDKWVENFKQLSNSLEKLFEKKLNGH